MSVASKLCVLALAGLLGLALFDMGPAPEELTQVSLRQLESDGSAAQELRAAESARNWRLLAWPLGLAALAAVLFWDDIEGWWTKGAGEPEA